MPDESFDKMQDQHTGPQPDSGRGVEDSFGAQLNLDQAINISHSNIKLLEGHRGMINNK